MLRLWFVYGPFTLRSWFVHGPFMVRLWTVHTPFTVRLQTVYAPFMVGLRQVIFHLFLSGAANEDILPVFFWRFPKRVEES